MLALQIWPIGLAMPRPAMSGAEPWTGSNRLGKRRSGLMFPLGAMPMVPVQAGPRSERMSPNRLEATTTSNQSGCMHEVRGQDVDVVLVHRDVGVRGGHRLDPFVPVGHRDRDAVALGGRGQVLLGPALREVEGVLEDAVDPDPGHHGFLDDGFAVGALEDLAADAGVFAFGVLPHHVEVDVAG